MGNLEEGKLASAQQNVEMPRRCYAQAISFLPGEKGSRFQIKSPGPGPARVPGPAQGRERQRRRQLADIRKDPRRSAFDDNDNNNNNSTSTAEHPHRIYRAVMWTTATIITNNLQILINLRRLGHQIKPAKSWLPLLERMLIEGFALSRHWDPGTHLAFGSSWSQILAAPNIGYWETSN